MEISIKLVGSLQSKRFRQIKKNYFEGTTVGAVLQDLNLDTPECGMVLINGRAAYKEMALQEGDTLTVFPLVGGG